jgi:nitrogen regulatory protein P-II 1
MRKIEAIIRKSKFGEVKRSLIEEGFNSFNYHLSRSISEKSEKRFYRGVEYDAKASDRVQLSLYVKYEDLERAISIIREIGHTGDADDNFIYIIEIRAGYQLIGGEDKDKLKELK